LGATAVKQQLGSLLLRVGVGYLVVAVFVDLVLDAAGLEPRRHRGIGSAPKRRQHKEKQRNRQLHVDGIRHAQAPWKTPGSGPGDLPMEWIPVPATAAVSRRPPIA